MKKLKDFFESIVDIFDGILLLFILVFGYPFYKKSLKEMWKLIIEHINKKDKY